MLYQTVKNFATFFVGTCGKLLFYGAETHKIVLLYMYAMDPELKQILSEMSAKIDATYKSAEKTRKYIWWTMVITITVIVLPLLLMPFAFSSMMSSYSTILNVVPH